MTLWTASEAAAATGGAANGEWEATGVALDSRSVSDGDLFVAVAGANRDGHPPERHHRPEALGNVSHFDEGSGHGSASGSFVLGTRAHSVTRRFTTVLSSTAASRISPVAT